MSAAYAPRCGWPPGRSHLPRTAQLEIRGSFGCAPDLGDAVWADRLRWQGKLDFELVAAYPRDQRGGDQRRLRARSAFPDRRNAPPRMEQTFPGVGVSTDVTLELRSPEFRPRRRGRCEAAARMPVPEASVHEDGCVMSREDDVRSAGEAGDIQSIPEARSMKGATHPHLRSGVTPSDPGHHSRPRAGVHNIDHTRLSVVPLPATQVK